MGHVPDFRNLYWKSLISMGTNDKENFMKKTSARRITEKDVPKWLTAYLWQDGKRSFGWRVIVYPAREDGSFTDFKPYYESTKPSKFEEAQEIMKLAEQNIFNDSFTTNEFFK